MNWLKANKTKAAVLMFIVIIAWWGSAAMVSAAEPKGYIALGHSTVNYKETTGEVAWTPGEWALAVQLIGEGESDGMRVETTRVVSFSRFVKAPFNDGKPYARIGVAYVESHNPFVGNWNFRLGLGYKWRAMMFEVGHYSSADIWDTNRGVDFIQVALLI